MGLISRVSSRTYRENVWSTPIQFSPKWTEMGSHGSTILHQRISQTRTHPHPSRILSKLGRSILELESTIPKRSSILDCRSSSIYLLLHRYGRTRLQRSPKRRSRCPLNLMNLNN